MTWPPQQSAVFREACVAAVLLCGAVSGVSLGPVREGRKAVSVRSRTVSLRDSVEKDELWHQSLWGWRSALFLRFSE